MWKRDTGLEKAVFDFSRAECEEPVGGAGLGLVKGVKVEANGLERERVKIFSTWGAWAAQSVKCWTLDLGLGHDLAVCEFEPRLGL